MDKISAQEIFDTVVTHLSGMTERSTAHSMIGDGCAYRGKDGAMCAVGCLINDDEYNHEMDDLDGDSSILSIYERNLLPHRLIPHLRLLEALQSVHDRSDNWTSNKLEMKIRLGIVAERFGLDGSMIDKVEWK